MTPTDPSIALRRLLTKVWQAALLQRSSGQELPPLAFRASSTPPQTVHATVVCSPDAAPGALRALSVGAAVVGTLSEAWAVVVELPEEKLAHVMSADLGVRNEERSNRVEILQMTAETSAGERHYWCAEICDGVVGPPVVCGEEAVFHTDIHGQSAFRSTN